MDPLFTEVVKPEELQFLNRDYMLEAPQINQ
jgi:hypothetical protein